MRTSLGQKMQRPGQGKGCVSTVTGATPLCVRIGFMRSRRSRSSATAGRRAARDQEPKALHQLAAVEEAATVLGMAAQDPLERRVVERSATAHASTIALSSRR